jgi:hypothetical protein
MRRLFTPFALLFVLLAIVASPATAKPHAGPLLVDAEAGSRVVFIDPNNPFPAFFDLHLSMENVTTDETITFTDISGEIEFRSGETTPFSLPVIGPEGEPLVLEPGFGSAFFALLILPMDAPTGGAVARVTITYEIGGEAHTEEIAVRFVVVQRPHVGQR